MCTGFRRQKPVEIFADYPRLKHKVPVVHKLKTMPWGNKTFQFRDPEGATVSLYMPATEEARRRFELGSECDLDAAAS
jgi:uncharacterized glyoxalase superfamily protein PhnB